MLLFGDSFGHYDTAQLLAKWDSIGDNQIVQNATLARTNDRCLQITSGAFGPARELGAHYTKLIQQVACNSDGPGTPQQFTVFEFQIAHFGPNIAVRVNGDATLSIWRGAGDVAATELYRTTVRPFVWNTWNYIECQVFFDATQGTVVLNVNGRQVASLVNQKTVALASDQYSNAVQLFGNSGNGNACFVADYALLDWSAAPNDAFIPQTKVYAEVPTANGTVAWTPLAGQNFQNVDEIPPDGDTSYNSSSTVGQTDQYETPLTAVPAAAGISAVQHCMDLRTDAGAQTVASVVGGVQGTASALTSAYLIYHVPYDQNPVGPAAWLQGDFPLGFGPKVTA